MTGSLPSARRVRRRRSRSEAEGESAFRAGRAGAGGPKRNFLLKDGGFAVPMIQYIPVASDRWDMV